MSQHNTNIFYKEKNMSPNNIANYLRLTLLLLDKKKESKEFLQSTVIRLDNAASETCHGMHHAVVLGQQMWREPR